PTKARKNVFYRWFNAVYDRCERAYAAVVRRAVRHTFPMMALFVALSCVTAWWFTRLPTGFLPTEDQGYAIMGVQLPDAASLARTRAVTDKLTMILKSTPGVRGWFLIGGNSLLDNAAASNAATYYLDLEPF